MSKKTGRFTGTVITGRGTFTTGTKSGTKSGTKTPGVSAALLKFLRTRLASTDRPLLLLPVRLETRFFPMAGGASELRIRIFPDQIHIDTHEPQLTAEELEWGRHFWEQTWRASDDTEAARRAWSQLADRFEPQRAAWIARALRPANPGDRPDTPVPASEPLPKSIRFPKVETKDESWTTPPRARALPKRWLALATSGTATLFAKGNPVPAELQAGPDPAAEISESAEDAPVDAGMRWMLDFDEAEKAGMALRIKLTRTQAKGIDRLIVFGVNSDLDHAAGANMLAGLLDAHHYTDGLAFVPQDTPTNNTSEAASGFASKEFGHDSSYTAELESDGSTLSDGSNADALTAALGIRRRGKEQVFGRIAGAQSSEPAEARHMNSAVWPATMGYFLTQMLHPALRENDVDWARSHFTEFVRAQGALPVLRCGRQPYGILPVTSLDLWRPLSANARSARQETMLKDVLQRLRAVWRRSLAKVPHVHRKSKADANKELTDILKMEPRSTNYTVRNALGRHYAQHLWPFIGRNLDATGWWKRQTALTAAVLRRLGLKMRTPRLSGAVFSPDVMALHETALPNDTSPVSSRADADCIRELLEVKDPLGLKNQTVKDPAQKTLLYFVLRHSLLLEYARAAEKILIKNRLISSSETREPELVDIAGGRKTRATAWRNLARRVTNVTGSASLSKHLAALSEFTDADVAGLGEIKSSLAFLQNMASDNLQRNLAGALDLCSHRLDGWISSLANKRLHELRQTNPSGILIGGFGWVENLKPAPAKRTVKPPAGVEAGPLFRPATDAGFLHAPSLDQAAMIAMLRNAHLAPTSRTNPGQRDLFAIDLSSRRVQLADWLLSGIRQGQPLGALLGYRFERGLHEHHPGLNLDRFIMPFREFAPLVAKKLESTSEPVETIAANNVVDGLRLHETWKQAGRIPSVFFARVRTLPSRSAAESNAIAAEMRVLDDAVNAVSDAILSESVFQAVRGNAVRAASTLDALTSGEAPPPELEFAETPGTGISLTHRLMVVFAQAPPGTSNWPSPAQPARSEAEPWLNGWVGRLLGNPRKVRCRVLHVDPESQAALGQTEFRLDALQMSPLDLIYALEGGGNGQPAEIEQRILFHANGQAVIPEDVHLRIDAERLPDWPLDDLCLSELLELVRAAKQVVSSARPLDGRDLDVPERASESEVDLQDLHRRTESAGSAFTESSAALREAVASEESENIQGAMVRLAQFGIQGAVPITSSGRLQTDASALHDQAASVLRECDRRIHASASLDSTFEPDTASAEDVQEHHIDKIRVLFGDSFLVLPVFRPAEPTGLQKSFSESESLTHGEPLALPTWMQRYGRVRPRVRGLSDALRYADALAPGALPGLEVAQLPYRKDDRWVGLPFQNGEAPDGGRLSIVAERNGTIEKGGRVAGLLIDEWVETIPGKNITAGVTFQYDQPNASAPQCALLAVPPDSAKQWTVAALNKVLVESLELAKLRTVDPDVLGEINHFLPALYFAFNAANDAVSTDFVQLKR